MDVNKIDDASLRLTESYRLLFEGASCPETSKRYLALMQALDIRKFEIEMYWKRATYFWTLIGASLVGYGVMNGLGSTSSVSSVDKLLLTSVVSALGLLFSIAWLLVNKGSKQWQENWENHVDLLEDDVMGPLYKTVLRRPRQKFGKGFVKEVISGPASFSVSAINQIISYFTTLVWLMLFFRTLPKPPFTIDSIYNWQWLIVAALIACVFLFCWAGRTHLNDHKNRAKIRVSRVVETDPQEMKIDASWKPEDPSLGKDASG